MTDRRDRINTMKKALIIGGFTLFGGANEALAQEIKVDNNQKKANNIENIDRTSKNNLTNTLDNDKYLKDMNEKEKMEYLSKYSQISTWNNKGGQPEEYNPKYFTSTKIPQISIITTVNGENNWKGKDANNLIDSSISSLAPELEILSPEDYKEMAKIATVKDITRNAIAAYHNGMEHSEIDKIAPNLSKKIPEITPNTEVRNINISTPMPEVWNLYEYVYKNIDNKHLEAIDNKAKDCTGEFKLTNQDRINIVIGSGYAIQDETGEAKERTDWARDLYKNKEGKQDTNNKTNTVLQLKANDFYR